MSDDPRPPAPDGILKKSFSFVEFEQWPHELYRATVGFAHEFGVHPNIMSATTEVYREIDFYVQFDLENVENENGEHPAEDEDVELASFLTPDCEVEFTINEMTPFPGFLLVYDEDPSFDGEPEPVEDGGTVAAVRYGVA
jgi:hypothetical protein